MFRSVKRIHFVGIGGTGMSGIAEVLLSLGFEVSGSDSKKSKVTERLEKIGAKIVYEHLASSVASSDVVVVSSAISKQNPELVAAQANKTPVVHRSEMLAELMRLKQGIVVAGTHGKTTTTSMLASVMLEAGLDPTCIIGGRLNAIGANAQVGKGDFFVAEADESDGSFLKLSPTIAVVTNIDKDHMDHYENFDSIVSAFQQFLDRVPFYGVVCACVDDPGVQLVLPGLRKQTITYGLSPNAQISAVDVKADGLAMRFKAKIHNQVFGEVRLNMPGRYNISNALASFAVAHALGVDPNKVTEALSNFGGVLHRFTIVGEFGNIIVVDDYAHNPKKIETVLRGVREAFPDRLICAVFQPHRYTRLKALWNEFAESFVDADCVVVTPVYAASEAPITGITSDAIGDAIAKTSSRDRKLSVSAALSLEESAKIAASLASANQNGAVVITLGAGDIQFVGEKVLEFLKK